MVCFWFIFTRAALEVPRSQRARCRYLGFALRALSQATPGLKGLGVCGRLCEHGEKETRKKLTNGLH